MTMTEITERYLGNCFSNQSLQQQVERVRNAGNCLEVELSQEDCARSRIYARTASDVEVGIIRDRSHTLSSGDVFEIASKRLLVIHLRTWQLLALSLPEGYSGSALTLIHLGHTLGNHHYPISVSSDKIYVRLVADPDVIERTILGFKIPGLVMNYETQMPAEPPDFASHLAHTH